MTDAAPRARRPRLWVVDPSIHEPETQGVAQVLAGWPGASRVLLPALRPGDGPAPRHGHDLDGIVVLGSSASVHDDLPWLRDLAAWLRPVVDGEAAVPLLGICFGHQLIASLAGARVGPTNDDGRKRRGVEESVLDGGRLLPGRRLLRVIVSHRESVLEAPPGYRVVARRAGVPVDGIEHERLPVFAFQFHPEARDEFAVRCGLDPACVDRRVVRDSDLLLSAFRRRVLAGA